MPGITPSHWLPLVVIIDFINLSYTLQRYNFFLNYANILVIIFKEYFTFSPLLIVPDSDLVPGRSEGRPGYMQPSVAGEQLVGIFPRLEEVHQALELPGVEWPDIGSLTDEVLRVPHAAHLTVHSLTTESRVDDDRPHSR